MYGTIKTFTIKFVPTFHIYACVSQPWDSTRIMVAELTSSGDQIVAGTQTQVTEQIMTT